MNPLTHNPPATTLAPLTPAEQALLDSLDALQSQREQQLRELVEINSSSLNPAGVNQIGAWFAETFAALTPDISRCPLPPWQRLDFNGTTVAQPLGDLWRFRCRPNAPIQVLLCGHTDTVFPIDSPFQHARQPDAQTLNGPGAADMKGGLLVLFSALELLQQHPKAEQIGWTVLLNPDEEIGSPGSAATLAAEAKRHDLGLIYEPALPDGNLAGARKGSGNFTFAIHGRAAHAGREPELGRNAIVRAAEIILVLQQLNQARTGLTLNTGMIQGGESTNKVPDLAVFKFNIRVQQPQDARWCEEQLRQLQQRFSGDGYQIELQGGFGRMPKTLDQPHLALYQLVQQCSAELGQPLSWSATGGCCDGNNLAASGLPNVDTLGVCGNFIHSPQEVIELPSLTRRARLSARILFQLAQQGLPFPSSRANLSGGPV